MLFWLKRIITGLALLALLCTAALYGVLFLSLPTLDGQASSAVVTETVKVERDSLGQAIIRAGSRQDAAYGLGYAHGQDRFFQMDLLRRNAAGELSQLFGEAALPIDEKMRFHQLRKRSKVIVERLPDDDKRVLQAYTQGVNDGRSQVVLPSYEYLLTGAKIRPWQYEDSVLAIFSMYLDLQSANYKRDKALILLEQEFGQSMVNFVLQPSNYQAALDNSTLHSPPITIPELSQVLSRVTSYGIDDPNIYGSNNWAVTGALTDSGRAMLSDDMHLGLAVPAIWYRTQLNYRVGDESYQVSGVSLPGAPAIVVGSNNKIAWGFTNGYLDTADWVELSQADSTWVEQEQILLPDNSVHTYDLVMSEYGPVEEFNNRQYALSWVAHQPYAVNLKLLAMEQAQTVYDATKLAPKVGIPVQNMLVVDDAGNAAWRPMGAIPARENPVDISQRSSNYSSKWYENDEARPEVVNPNVGKLWTANSRVVSATLHKRYGDGGYALGARAVQIRDRLFAKSSFDEQDFNQLQHDNEALFLTRWHTHLVEILNQNTAMHEEYKQDLHYLSQWQACACEQSIGYTLVKHFRSSLIDVLFSPVEGAVREHGGSLKYLKRYFEPAVWQLLKEQPESWLNHHGSWQSLQLYAYEQAKQKLSDEFGPSMKNWSWGKVNALQVKHPFSKQIPVLSKLLDMPSQAGFGDTFMPAVQGPSFGASQRFIAQPGRLEHAIMTVAGGQSEHPLSPYYRTGFDEYVKGGATPLLPGVTVHSLVISPK